MRRPSSGPGRVRGAVAVLAAFATLLAGPVGADDEAWRRRVEKEVLRIERGVAILDQGKPVPGALLARVTALDARLRVLETAAGVDSKALLAREDLTSLTSDVSNLAARWLALVTKSASKAPSSVGSKKVEAPKGEPGAGDAKATGGKPPPAPEWPAEVRFRATAKMVYEETGEWFRTPGAAAAGDDFLMDGYKGRISFTLRAAGLRHDVRSAHVQVAVRLASPFTQATDAFRVLEVDWTATQSVFGNDSVKSWVNHDEVTVTGPVRWIPRPRSVSASLDVEARVMWAILADGTKLTFDVPTFAPR